VGRCIREGDVGACKALEKPLPDMRRESMEDSLEREACLVPSRTSACAGAGK
jgi:hypothetical protein